jgi:hypothetical protein
MGWRRKHTTNHGQRLLEQFADRDQLDALMIWLEMHGNAAVPRVVEPMCNSVITHVAVEIDAGVLDARLASCQSWLSIQVARRMQSYAIACQLATICTRIPHAVITHSYHLRHMAQCMYIDRWPSGLLWLSELKSM